MRLPLVLLGSVALIIGACGAATPVAATPQAPATSAVAASAPAASPGSVAASPLAPQLAAFLTMTLTDARTGEKFTLGDYKGKVTIVEGMAVW